MAAVESLVFRADSSFLSYSYAFCRNVLLVLFNVSARVFADSEFYVLLLSLLFA